MISCVAVLAVIAAIIQSSKGDEFVLLGDPDDLENGLMVHCYPERQCIVTTDRDGAEVFLVRKQVLASVNNPQELSIESAKFPGYFIVADGKTVKLKKPNSERLRERGTFLKHDKIRTAAQIFQLSHGFPYSFVCNTYTVPYPMYIKIDDDSKYFADRCSYGYSQLDKKKALDRVGTIDEIPETALKAPGKGVTDGSILGPGARIKLYIPGVLGARPVMGIKVEANELVRVGLVPDLLKVHMPGLNGEPGGASIEAEAYPGYFLQRRGRDVYLSLKMEGDDFADAATFKLKRFVGKKSTYYLHPYSEPEWSLGYLHEPPHFVRSMHNNNSAEYDHDTSWILKLVHPKKSTDSIVKTPLLHTLSKAVSPNHHEEHHIVDIDTHTDQHAGHLTGHLEHDEGQHDLIGGHATSGDDHIDDRLHTTIAEILGTFQGKESIDSNEPITASHFASPVVTDQIQDEHGTETEHVEDNPEHSTTMTTDVIQPQQSSHHQVQATKETHHVTTTHCPASCRLDCNPKLCSLPCCSIINKKQIIPTNRKRHRYHSA